MTGIGMAAPSLKKRRTLEKVSLDVCISSVIQPRQGSTRAEPVELIYDVKELVTDGAPKDTNVVDVK
eukprot:CAMPEP_0171669044 /NCGR_PEP_ID=MMETSP0990-20121206/49733_1 /TAXON_ID=483369 /ORGANISM="non described non described, Strain CCMP2098" /LENGTH=66 /DNA_ID=CAMNT_0012253215 /DNA_START=430 /DNA_END=626 /DNA_ORIENTATION=+